MSKRIRALGASEKWIVQAAYSGGIEPRTFTNETDAGAKVSELLRHWLLRNWWSIAEMVEVESLKEALTDVESMINFGRVWDALDAIHDIEQRLTTQWPEIPAWYRVGTIRLDAPRGKGPKNRLPLIKNTDFPKATNLTEIHRNFIRWRYCGNSGYFKLVPADFPRLPLLFINPIRGNVVEIEHLGDRVEVHTTWAQDFTQEDVNRGIEAWQEDYEISNEEASQAVDQWSSIGAAPDPLKKLLGLDADSRDRMLTWLFEAIDTQPSAERERGIFAKAGSNISELFTEVADLDEAVRQALEILRVSEC